MSYFDRYDWAVREIHGELVEVILCPPSTEVPKHKLLAKFEDWEDETSVRRNARQRRSQRQELDGGNTAARRLPTAEKQFESLAKQHAYQRFEDEMVEVDLRYFEPYEAPGIRSLIRPTIDNSDWIYPAAAARCVGCGVVTWTCRLSDGEPKMLASAKHAKDCPAPPSRLEVEASACDE